VIITAEAVADIIADAVANTYVDGPDFYAIEDLANRFAAHLEQTSPGFDREAFLEKCELT